MIELWFLLIAMAQRFILVAAVKAMFIWQVLKRWINSLYKHVRSDAYVKGRLLEQEQRRRQVEHHNMEPIETQRQMVEDAGARVQR